MASGGIPIDWDKTKRDILNLRAPRVKAELLRSQDVFSKEQVAGFSKEEVSFHLLCLRKQANQQSMMVKFFKDFVPETFVHDPDFTQAMEDDAESKSSSSGRHPSDAALSAMAGGEDDDTFEPHGTTDASRDPETVFPDRPRTYSRSRDPAVGDSRSRVGSVSSADFRQGADPQSMSGFSSGQR